MEENKNLGNQNMGGVNAGQTSPNGGGNKQKPKGSKSGLILKIVIAIAVCIIAGVQVYQIMRPSDSAGAGRVQSKQERDDNALQGKLDNAKNDEERQAIIDEEARKGMFNFSINSETKFEDGASKGRLAIENVKENNYLMKVKITLDDTGETVYTSGMLDPGYYIEYAKLNKKLAKGNYQCTAVFTAFDKETEDVVGSTNASIVLVIQN